MKAFFLPLKRIIYRVLHGKKYIEVKPIKFQVGIEKVKLEGTLDEKQTKEFKKTKLFYENKKNCKCYECLSNESKDCFVNCLPAAGFEYTAMPCKSCEFRSWCYTKYE